MRLLLPVVILLISTSVNAQSLGRVPDSVRNRIEADRRGDLPPAAPVSGTVGDEEIKARLVKLAMKNPAITIAEANMSIAEASQEKAKTSWLSYINAGANINEFVVQGSPAASFFPKYNVGVSIPFDIVARHKLAKRTADETYTMNAAIKRQQEMALKAEVLTRYETYKEKRELVQVQKISVDSDLTSYEAGQQAYADGDITLTDMNKLYQSYTLEKGKLVSAEKDLNIAIIRLEELIGVPLVSVIPQ